jgi:hypothetical protein
MSGTESTNYESCVTVIYHELLGEETSGSSIPLLKNHGTFIVLSVSLPAFLAGRCLRRTGGCGDRRRVGISLVSAEGHMISCGKVTSAYALSRE